MTKDLMGDIWPMSHVFDICAPVNHYMMSLPGQSNSITPVVIEKCDLTKFKNR